MLLIKINILIQNKDGEYLGLVSGKCSKRGKDVRYLNIVSCKFSRRSKDSRYLGIVCLVGALQGPRTQRSREDLGYLAIWTKAKVTPHIKRGEIYYIYYT